jgi:hypothetical protein
VADTARLVGDAEPASSAIATAAAADGGFTVALANSGLDNMPATDAARRAGAAATAGAGRETTGENPSAVSARRAAAFFSLISFLRCFSSFSCSAVAGFFFALFRTA